MQLTSWLQTFLFFFFGGGGGKQVKSIQGIRIQHILFQMMVFVTSQIWSTRFTIHAQANTVYIWCCKREEFFSRVHPYFCSWLLRKRFIYKVLTKSVNTMCFSLLALRNKIIVHKTVFVHHNGLIIFKYDTVSLNAPWAWLSPVAVWSALHIDNHRHLWLESRQPKMPKSELTTHNYTVEWDAQKPAGHVHGKFTWPSSDCMTNQSTKPVFFLILLLQLTVLTNPSYVSVNHVLSAAAAESLINLCQCHPCSFCHCKLKIDPNFKHSANLCSFCHCKLQIDPNFKHNANLCSFCHCSWKFDPMMSVLTHASDKLASPPVSLGATSVNKSCVLSTIAV